LGGDKQKRLAKIQQQWQRWRPTPGCGGGRASHRGRKGQQRQAEAAEAGKPAAGHRTNLIPSPQRNFPIGKPHHESKDGFVQAYNAQAAVDSGRPDHCRHELTAVRQRSGPAGPLIKAIENNLAASRSRLSGLGYCSEANLEALKHTVSTAMSRPDAPSTRPPRTEKLADRDPTDAKEDRRWRLRNPYRLRKQVVEPDVRTDQTGARLPPVPVAGRRESAGRVGLDRTTHNSQAVQPSQTPRETATLQQMTG